MAKFFKNNSISFHRIFKSCADSTTRVFLPILIYQQTQNLYFVFAFFVIQYLLWGLLSLGVKHFIHKHAFWLVSLSFIPFIGILFFVSFFKIDLFGVFMLAVLTSTGSGIYSVAMNNIFTINKKTNNVARFDSASIAGKLIFTFITAYLLQNSINNSFIALLIMGSSLYIISTFFIFLNKKEVCELLLNSPPSTVAKSIKTNKSFNLIHVCFGIFQNIIDTLLPLYLFHFNFNIQQVSYVLILSDLIKIAVNYFAKYLNAKNKDNLMIIISGALFSATAILIPFFQNQTFYFSISIALPLLFPLAHVSIFSRFIKQIEQSNDFITGHSVRDFFIITPRAIFYATFFVIPSFTSIFLLSSIFGMGMIASNQIFLANKEQNNKSSQQEQKQTNTLSFEEEILSEI